MKLLRIWIATAIISMVGSAAASLTVKEYNCGSIADGEASTCGIGSPINLTEYDLFSFEATLGGIQEGQGSTPGVDGSLTLSFYVDPYYSTTSTNGNLRLNTTGFLPFSQFYGAQTFTLSFGGLDIDLDYANKTYTFDFLGFFTEGGLGGAKDMVLTWTGMQGFEAVSLDIAAVPLPAGGILLLTALGGLGFARRRRSAEAALA